MCHETDSHHMQHLYVMQNHLGLIKIGRSINVESRRRNLEKADLCSIQIVAIFENEGHREEPVHIKLDRQRLIGEWFDGDTKSVKKIIKIVGLSPDIVWPYPIADNDEICDWLERVEEKRSLISADKEYQRCIREMASTSPENRDDGIRFYDGKIWTILWRFEHRERTIYTVDQASDGSALLIGHREGCDEPEIIPRYTSDIQGALAIWPDELRPEQWDGAIWDCCVAGLRARKTQIAQRRLRD